MRRRCLVFIATIASGACGVRAVPRRPDDAGPDASAASDATKDTPADATAAIFDFNRLLVSDRQIRSRRARSRSQAANQDVLVALDNGSARHHRSGDAHARFEQQRNDDVHTVPGHGSRLPRAGDADAGFSVRADNIVRPRRSARGSDRNRRHHASPSTAAADRTSFMPTTSDRHMADRSNGYVDRAPHA